MKGKKSIVIMLVCMIAMICCACGHAGENGDVINYEGDNYRVMEFPADIFTYDLNKVIECGEDEIVPVTGGDWKLVYHEGDVYCHEDDFDEAAAYYSDVAGYEWQIVVDEKAYPLDLTKEEIAFFDTVEDMEKTEAIFFEEIQEFGTLQKISRDGMINGVTELAYYGDSWCWRSEIIDESREEDGTWPEYIQKLPETLTDKIEHAR